MSAISLINSGVAWFVAAAVLAFGIRAGSPHQEHPCPDSLLKNYSSSTANCAKPPFPSQPSSR